MSNKNIPHQPALNNSPPLEGWQAQPDGVVPRLRFPEFRDAGEWCERKLEEFLKESRILGSKGDIAKKITVKLWGKGVFGKEEVLKGSINTQYYQRKGGQFIYSKLDFLNGAFGIIPDLLDGFESTVDLPCLDIDEKISPVFLLEYVKREDFYKNFGEIADGGRKAKRIQVDAFLSFPVILPPRLEEQQKIADCLASIDHLITTETQKLNTLKAHKKGLMQQLFPAEGETLPKLRFPRFEDQWKEGTIDNLAITVMGNAFKSSDFTESGIQLVRMGNLYQGELQLNRMPVYLPAFFSGEYSKFLIKPLDLLMSMTGTVGKKDYGFIVQTPKSCKPLLLNQRVMKIVPKKNCVKEFLLQLLQNESLLNNLYSLPGGTKQANLSAQHLKDLEIIFPHQTEQQKIADCLSSLDELTAAQTQKIDTLKTHKKGLMQQLFPAIDEVKE